MGRLEKQIIAGALGLVGVLLSIVVFKGLQPRPSVAAATFVPGPTDYPDEAVAVPLSLKLPVELRNSNFDSSFSEVVDSPSLDLGAAEEVVSVSAPEGLLSDDTIPPFPSSYTVKEKDTLGEIAQKLFGTVRAQEDILRVNEGLRPDELFAGQVLVLPNPSSMSWVQGDDVASDNRSLGSVRTHTVKAGDSLWKIAKKYFDDGNRGDRIVEANPTQLTHIDNVLHIGTVLVIPE